MTIKRECYPRNPGSGMWSSLHKLILITALEDRMILYFVFIFVPPSPFLSTVCLELHHAVHVRLVCFPINSCLFALWSVIVSLEAESRPDDSMDWLRQANGSRYRPRIPVGHWMALSRRSSAVEFTNPPMLLASFLVGCHWPGNLSHLVRPIDFNATRKRPGLGRYAEGPITKAVKH
jgi:hypothetical protein